MKNDNKKNEVVLLGNRKFRPINLSEYFNNDGISYDNLKCDGDFDGKGCTYPAEELPESNSLIAVDGVPFYFSSKEVGCKNNMIFEGQVILLPEDYYMSLFVLGAVEGQNGEAFEESLTFSFNDGKYDSVYVGLSNWLLEPIYNERIAFFCTHLHYPDSRQVANSNSKIKPSYLEYDLKKGITNYQAKQLEMCKKLECDQNDWKPKILFQNVNLNFLKPITAVTFMDNPLFHIFALTLEVKVIK